MTSGNRAPDVPDYMAMDYMRDDTGAIIAAVSAAGMFFVLVLPMLVALMALAFWPVYKLIEFLY
jgi:hypothetical protein